MKKLQIFNDYGYHYEIIESVIVKYKEILKIVDELQIWLHVKYDDAFVKYIKLKYPKIIFGKIQKYDYYINCTIYDRNFVHLQKNPCHKYIAHELSTRLKTNPNVYFLTPFAGKNYFSADILPFSAKRKTQKPVYIIQGNLNHNRRHLPSLIKILENKYDYDFTIKMIGNGVLPRELQKYKNRILLKTNLNFVDYHAEFMDAYCILPLITKKSHPHYYRNKLTSSINYAKAYSLKCLIDKDLQNIYKLDNVEVYNNDIVSAFRKTLKDFYN